MALYYQNFYILVVFVPFLHTSRTFVLPVHAVQDSAQVLEERVEHELGSRATHLPPNEEPGLSSPAPHIPAHPPQPNIPVPGGREEDTASPTAWMGCSQALVFPDISTGAH